MSENKDEVEEDTMSTGVRNSSTHEFVEKCRQNACGKSFEAYTSDESGNLIMVGCSDPEPLVSSSDIPDVVRTALDKHKRAVHIDMSMAESWKDYCKRIVSLFPVMQGSDGFTSNQLHGLLNIVPEVRERGRLTGSLSGDVLALPDNALLAHFLDQGLDDNHSDAEVDLSQRKRHFGKSACDEYSRPQSVDYDMSD